MKYDFLRFPGGKEKAVTFSYDDGSRHDARLCDTLNRYGLKCTFNLVGSKIESGASSLSKEWIEENILGHGHEIANHGYEHRGLDVQRPIEGIKEILDCRLVLEREFGRIVRGFAYPDRSINRFQTPVIYEQIRSYLVELDIAYARSLGNDNDTFALPEDFLHWMPTAHHDNPELFDYIDRFLAFDDTTAYRSRRGPKLFYLWGHAHEFEQKGHWDRLTEICERLSGHEEIWYATNMEICQYVEAYRALEHSADGRTVYNPTLLDVWFDIDGTLYCVKSGQTLKIA